MSSPDTPYAAPWQTGFERYATQLYTPGVATVSDLRMTVPSGQWWRIIYLGAEFITTTAPASRACQLQITDAKARTLLLESSAGFQPGGADYRYLFGPSLTSSVNVSTVSAGSVTGIIPAAGNAQTAGSGFTYTHVNGSGVYVFTFNPTFAATPIILVDVLGPNWTNPLASVNLASATGFTVWTQTAINTWADAPFSFYAVGVA